MAFRKVRSEEGGSEMAPANTGNALSAFIDQGSEFEGKLTFKDTVRIDGTFRGEISSENTLIVGETGEIHATVRSRNVLVSGTVTGDIHASDRLVLNKTARVDGDIEVGAVAIEEGATVNGQIKMNAGSVSAPAGATSWADSEDD